jgi:hypothetical protein
VGRVPMVGPDGKRTLAAPGRQTEQIAHSAPF